jgi:DNA helicase-2/ATP-dependent DNA helicase PcrA
LDFWYTEAGAPRAQINFGRAGVKVLDLSVAKLERISR